MGADDPIHPINFQYFYKYPIHNRMMKFIKPEFIWLLNERVLQFQELELEQMKCIPKGKGVLKVIDKKLDGEKIFYLMAKGRWRKWIDFEDLNEHLQLVIDFEEILTKKAHEKDKIKENKLSEKESSSNKEKEKQKDEKGYEKKIQEMRSSAKMKTISNEIKNIIFLNVIEKDFFFKVIYEGGREQIMNNQQLRLQHPQELITFYENNVEIGESKDKRGSS